MTIQEMHTAFRIFGQQMGMQEIRGILPESIDAFLNAAILEKVRTELAQSNLYNSKLDANNKGNTMSNINILRNLYKTSTYKITTSNPTELSNGIYKFIVPTINVTVTVDTGEYLIDPMMYLGVSISYTDNKVGYCRIVAEDELRVTLDDYCNTADKLHPIVTIESLAAISDGKENTNEKGMETFTLYVGNKVAREDIGYIGINYIKNPAKVKNDINNNDNNVNCDLPDYCHQELVELAVNKYRQVIAVQPISNSYNQKDKTQ